MKEASIFLGACLASFLLTPVAQAIARRNRILDYPESRKMHDRPTPLLGGTALYAAFLITTLFIGPHTWEFGGVLLGSTLIFLVSLVNDIRELSTFARLIFQFLGAFVMLLFGVKLTFLPPGLLGDAGEILLTLLWVIGLANAMNFLDGLDGLAGGLGLIIGLFFYLVAQQINQHYFGLLALAMAGASLGFLPYNFPAPFSFFKRAFQRKKRSSEPGGGRAMIFLGDSGATFLGAFYAGLSVMGDLAVDNVIALAVPILLLGVPIFDTTFITVMRLREGKVSNLSGWLAYAGKDHFHHRLVDLGFSKTGAVFFIYCVALTLGIDALVLRDAVSLDAVLILIKSALIFILIALLMITGMRTAKEGKKRP